MVVKFIFCRTVKFVSAFVHFSSKVEQSRSSSPFFLGEVESTWMFRAILVTEFSSARNTRPHHQSHLFWNFSMIDQSHIGANILISTAVLACCAYDSTQRRSPRFPFLHTYIKEPNVEQLCCFLNGVHSLTNWSEANHVFHKFLVNQRGDLASHFYLIF